MTDEEIRALVDEFNRKVSLDPEIRSVMQKIRNQDVDFSDTSRMFWRRSELLRDYLQGIVLDLPAGAREQLCTALLNAGYNETNEVMQSVQQAQDEPQGIHLNPVLPKRPAERIHTVAHALEDPTVPDDKIVRRAGAPVANVQMSFHDRYIEENAKIRAKLGMKPTITRYGSGCCAWCSAVAGRYRFGDQPKDIFRRHDNCGCTIIYDNQVLRGHRNEDDGSSRAWEAVDPAEVMANGFQPTVFSQDHALLIEIKHGKKEATDKQTIDFFVKGDILKGEYNEKDIIRAITQKGTNFVTTDPNDPESIFGELVELIPPDPRYYDIKAHGSPTAIKLFGSVVDARTLAKVITFRDDYTGKPIRLLCCETGKEENNEICFAKQLSDLLGVKVLAPTETFWVSTSGEVKIESKETGKKGRMKPFNPK